MDVPPDDPACRRPRLLTAPPPRPRLPTALPPTAPPGALDKVTRHVCLLTAGRSCSEVRKPCLGQSPRSEGWLRRGRPR